MGGVFLTLASLTKQLRSLAMRLFRRLVIAKNTLAENGTLFHPRSLVSQLRHFPLVYFENNYLRRRTIRQDNMNGENNFFKSAFSVDNVIFGFDDGDLKVLLIKRGQAPFQGLWALPGDLVYPNEDLDTAAYRVLEELTGLKKVYLEQVHTFGSVDRHPLGRVITIAYFSLVKISDFTLTAASFAQNVEWHNVDDAMTWELAFDHHTILETCFNALTHRVRIRPVGFELLPPKFTLTELQHLYEALLRSELDKRNFRKKILSMSLLIDLDEYQAGVPHRPAKLYQFNTERYHQLEAHGFSFEVKESRKKEKKKRLAELIAQ